MANRVCDFVKHSVSHVPQGQPVGSICWQNGRGAGSSSRRKERGSQGTSPPQSWLPTSPALEPGKGGKVAAGGVTARVLLTQAGRGAGLAVVTPGPLSPRFSQALSFLGGRKKLEGVEGETCEESEVSKAGSICPSGYGETIIRPPSFRRCVPRTTQL